MGGMGHPKVHIQIFMLEECGYMEEECGCMPEERGYMEEKKTMNSVATTFATQPVCNAAQAEHALPSDKGRNHCIFLFFWDTLGSWLWGGHFIKGNIRNFNIFVSL
jgi:hypothetical protein